MEVFRGLILPGGLSGLQKGWREQAPLMRWAPPGVRPLSATHLFYDPEPPAAPLPGSECSPGVVSEEASCV